MAQKFYVVSSEYVGPNPGETPEGTTMGIYRTPGKTNQSHEERIDGWLGTTNDVSETAHGEFETIEEARQYIQKYFGEDCRKTEFDAIFDEDEEPDCVESSTEGKCAYMSRRDSVEFVETGGAIEGTETDDELKEAVESSNDVLKNSGEPCQLSSDILDTLVALRDKRKEEFELPILEKNFRVRWRQSPPRAPQRGADRVRFRGRAAALTRLGHSPRPQAGGLAPYTPFLLLYLAEMYHRYVSL